MITISKLLSPKHEHTSWVLSRMLSLIDQRPSEDGCFIYTFSVPSMEQKTENYMVTVKLQRSDKVTSRTKCEVSCNCPNFIYWYETKLSREHGLYGQPRSPKLPKKVHFGCCKHVDAVLRHLLKRTISSNIEE